MSENVHVNHQYILMGGIEQKSNTTQMLLLLKYSFTVWFCEDAFLSVHPFKL